MNYSLHKLGDLCQIFPGGTPARSRREHFGGGIPWVKISDMLQGTVQTTEETLTEAGISNSSAKLLPPGTVLISIFATIGRTAMLGIGAATNQAIAGIVPKDRNKLDPLYLRYFLDSRRDALKRLARGVAQPNINQTILKALEVALPPLHEQRRIVDILSRAEGILRLRREAQKKTQELIPALFLDMFGDPATNPKGWPVGRFGGVGTLDRGRSRHRPRDAQELYGGPYPFIQTGDVANSGGRITNYTATYSEAGLAQSKLWPKGTLCITIAANIAKTGVLDFAACFPDSVVGFLPSDLVRTEYVRGWLGFLQPTLEANAPQAAQKNINLEILRNLPIPVPPVPSQEWFEEKCQDVLSIQSAQSAATSKAEAAFQALLQGTFAS
jgi:type I restriction enzyme, S subunit